MSEYCVACNSTGGVASCSVHSPYVKKIEMPEHEAKSHLIDYLSKRNKDLQSRLGLAVECLKFYAEAFKKQPTSSMMGEYTPFLIDGGKRARECLKQIEGEKKTKLGQGLKKGLKDVMKRKDKLRLRCEKILTGLGIELKNGEIISINEDECRIQYLGVNGGRLIFNAPKDKYRIKRVIKD